MIFFGDSICHGQHVSVERHFVVQLAAYYNARLTPPLLVENRSINGNTSRQALERLSYDVTSQRPDMVYVQFGLNDCNVWQTDFGRPRVALEAYKANLREIIEKVQAAGATRVIVGTNHPCLLGEPYEERLCLYNRCAREAAAETGAVLFDVRATARPFDPSRMLMVDGIHLSEAGHDFYYEEIRPVFGREVRKLRGDPEEQSVRLPV